MIIRFETPNKKGRLNSQFPQKRQLENEECPFVLPSSLYGECLELWPYDSFEAEIAQLQKELNPYSIEDRKLLRKLSAGNIVEMDTNDRIVIPTVQRGRIKTSKDLVLQSTGKFIEIWDHDTYCRMNEEESDFAERIDQRLGKAEPSAAQ